MEMDLKIIFFAFEYLYPAYYQKILYTNDKSFQKIVSKTLPNSVHYFFYFLSLLYLDLKQLYFCLWLSSPDRQVALYIVQPLENIFHYNGAILLGTVIYLSSHLYTKIKVEN